MLLLFRLSLLSAALATVWTSPVLIDYKSLSFGISCRNRVINYIYTEYSNHFKDRRYEIRCGSPNVTMECENSGYVNVMGQPINFLCSKDKGMTDIGSHHDNYYEDRRFKFGCCGIIGKKLSNCYWTDEVNTLGGPMTLQVPDGQVIQGAHSYRDDFFMDRIWRFRLCLLEDDSFRINSKNKNKKTSLKVNKCT
ncbi:dermatopontin-like [Physella acuta]|uniref:dermatopontin-like n=1 Tax=Physella acuta TaxID=109671 RepID=UPI0027DB3F69|nr:dermatopontin-like [Physella acuta]